MGQMPTQLLSYFTFGNKTEKIPWCTSFVILKVGRSLTSYCHRENLPLCSSPPFPGLNLSPSFLNLLPPALSGGGNMGNERFGSVHNSFSLPVLSPQTCCLFQCEFPPSLFCRINLLQAGLTMGYSFLRTKAGRYFLGSSTGCSVDISAALLWSSPWAGGK